MNYLEIRWQAGSTYFKVVHQRSEEHTSELQSRLHLVCRLLLEKKKKKPPATSGECSDIARGPSAKDVVHGCRVQAGRADNNFMTCETGHECTRPAHATCAPVRC